MISTHFLGDIPLFATGRWHHSPLDGSEKVMEARMKGCGTCVRETPNSVVLLSNGEDGRVLRIGHDSSLSELANVSREWVCVISGKYRKTVSYGVG